jgi:hypothetical protein
VYLVLNRLLFYGSIGDSGGEYLGAEAAITLSFTGLKAPIQLCPLAAFATTTLGTNTEKETRQSRVSDPFSFSIPPASAFMHTSVSLPFLSKNVL